MLLEFLGSLKYEFISDIVPVAVALPECDINISCPRLVPATFDMNDVSRMIAFVLLDSIFNAPPPP